MLRPQAPLDKPLFPSPLRPVPNVLARCCGAETQLEEQEPQ